MYEAVIASVVLAFAMIALCSELTAANAMNQTLSQTATAVALARELLDEITAFPLANPSTGLTTPVAVATTGSRANFGYASAYNLYTDYGASLPEITGTTINVTNGAVYKRTVTVQTGAVPTGDTVSPTTDFALVTVKVTTPMGQTISLQRILTNYTMSR